MREEEIISVQGSDNLFMHIKQLTIDPNISVVEMGFRRQVFISKRPQNVIVHVTKHNGGLVT